MSDEPGPDAPGRQQHLLHRVLFHLRRHRLIVLAVVAALSVLWAVLAATVDGIDFVIYAPGGPTGVPLLLAGSEVFACIVLLLFPVTDSRDRIRWAAMAFLTVAMGTVLYGAVFPRIGAPDDPDHALYGLVLTLTFSTVPMILGMVPRQPPAFSERMPVLIVMLLTLIGMTVSAFAHGLPALSEGVDLEEAARTSDGLLHGLTTWYRVFSLLPFPLGVVALVGAIRNLPAWAPGGWMPLSIVFTAAGYLHAILWPAAFREIFTTGQLLGIGAVSVVALGAILDIDQISAERAEVLRSQQDQLDRLDALAQLRADFASMAAHELSGPLSAIRRATELLALDLEDDLRRRMLDTISRELAQTNALITELAASGTLERLGYELEIEPLRVEELIHDAQAFGSTIAGDHDIQIPDQLQGLVLADRRRIGQVMRNLLSNAIKYSAKGEPITIHVIPEGRSVRFEVRDRGPGIQADELQRIFEKFARGRGAVDRRIPGMGLGLYVSYRIVQAHGGELTVTSTPGEGSVFGFSLPAADAAHLPEANETPELMGY